MGKTDYDNSQLVEKFLKNCIANKQGGRLRIATPNFDFQKFVSERYHNRE